MRMTAISLCLVFSYWDLSHSTHSMPNASKQHVLALPIMRAVRKLPDKIAAPQNGSVLPNN